MISLKGKFSKVILVGSVFLLFMLLATHLSFGITAKEILERVKEQIKNESIRDTTIVQISYLPVDPTKKILEESDLQPISESITMFKNPDRMRLETRSLGRGGGPSPAPTLIIKRGKKIWLITPYGKQELIGSEREGINDYREIFDRIKDKDLSLVGREAIEGRKAYLLEYKYRDPRSKVEGRGRVWVDEDRWTFLKLEWLDASGKSSATMLMKDFKEVKGVGWIPFLTEVYGEQGLVMITKIKDFKYNTGLKDDLFNPDKVKLSQ